MFEILKTALKLKLGQKSCGKYHSILNKGKKRGILIKKLI